MLHAEQIVMSRTANALVRTMHRSKSCHGARHIGSRAYMA